MGYTHYWYRQEEISKDSMQKIVEDFKKVLPQIQEAGVMLANGRGKEKPVINENEVCFNGLAKCGHLINTEGCITWPSKEAGGVLENPFKEQGIVGKWFAGALLNKRMCDGDCSYETFSFSRVFRKQARTLSNNNNLYFDFCKTAFRPYDLAVITFLIIAKHHLGEKIKVSSDGEDNHWFDGKFLCQTELGYGLDYIINKGGNLEQQ